MLRHVVILYCRYLDRLIGQCVENTCPTICSIDAILYERVDKVLLTGLRRCSNECEPEEKDTAESGVRLGQLGDFQRADTRPPFQVHQVGHTIALLVRVGEPKTPGNSDETVMERGVRVSRTADGSNIDEECA